jgi:hypothetical protein
MTHARPRHSCPQHPGLIITRVVVIVVVHILVTRTAYTRERREVPQQSRESRRHLLPAVATAAAAATHT